MTTAPADASPGLTCHRCGYDLRAHPHDASCPECGASVAEARRWAAVPLRPAWHDADPRWRRRVLAGVWALVLLPLMDAMQAFGWAERVPVPTVYDSWGTVHTLADTLVGSWGVYTPIVFCVGVVLLFTRERGRRPLRLDWTSRWGVLCSYVVLLLSAAQYLLLVALVTCGMAAVFHSMPVSQQPGVTHGMAQFSSIYLRYGPAPTDNADAVLTAFSSVTVLLACVPLFDALRSSGPPRVAAVLLAPLALFALMHLAQAGRHYLGLSSEMLANYVYFWPAPLAGRLGGRSVGFIVQGSMWSLYVVEATKWCILLVVAVWLTIAQFAAWRQGLRG